MNSDATPPVSSDVTLTYAGWQVPRVPIVLPLQAPCISTFVSAPGGCPGVPRGHMSVPSGLGLFSSACRSEIWGQEAVGGPQASYFLMEQVLILGSPHPNSHPGTCARSSVGRETLAWGAWRNAAMEPGGGQPHTLQGALSSSSAGSGEEIPPGTLTWLPLVAIR